MSGPLTASKTVYCSVVFQVSCLRQEPQVRNVTAQHTEKSPTPPPPCGVEKRLQRIGSFNVPRRFLSSKAPQKSWVSCPRGSQAPVRGAPAAGRSARPDCLASGALKALWHSCQAAQMKLQTTCTCTNKLAKALPHRPGSVSAGSRVRGWYMLECHPAVRVNNVKK